MDYTYLSNTPSLLLNASSKSSAVLTTAAPSTTANNVNTVKQEMSSTPSLTASNLANLNQGSSTTNNLNIDMSEVDELNFDLDLDLGLNSDLNLGFEMDKKYPFSSNSYQQFDQLEELLEFDDDIFSISNRSMESTPTITTTTTNTFMNPPSEFSLSPSILPQDDNDDFLSNLELNELFHSSVQNFEVSGLLARERFLSTASSSSLISSPSSSLSLPSSNRTNKFKRPSVTHLTSSKNFKPPKNLRPARLNSIISGAGYKVGKARNSSLTNLSNYSLSSNAITKPIVCHICNVTLSRADSLKIHIDSLHNNTKYQCPYPQCGKLLGSQAIRRRHISIAHERDLSKMYVCFKELSDGETIGCLKCFGRSEQLNNHWDTKKAKRKCGIDINSDTNIIPRKITDLELSDQLLSKIKLINNYTE